MKMKKKKKIEMTLDEAKILDGELYKLQLELNRRPADRDWETNTN